MDVKLVPLLQLVRDPDFHRASDAILPIAMLLEWHRGRGPATNAANQAMYREVLSEEIRGVLFSEHTEAEILSQLRATALESPLQSQIIWAIGKSAPALGLEALFAILTGAPPLQEESIYQLCIAVRDLVELSDQPHELTQAKRLLERGTEFRRFLDVALKSHDERVARGASAALAAVENVVDM